MGPRLVPFPGVVDGEPGNIHDCAELACLVSVHRTIVASFASSSSLSFLKNL